MLSLTLLHSESRFFEHMLVETNADELVMDDTFHICYVLKGTLQIRCHDKIRHIRENDIFFFPSNVPYSIECHGKTVLYYQIRIFDEYLKLLDTGLTDVYFDYFHIMRNDNELFFDRLCNYIASVLFLSVSDEALKSFRQLTDINRILFAINQEYSRYIQRQESWTDQTGKRIKDILQIIQTKYQEKLRLEDVAKMTGFHPQYFSAFFTKIFHEKFTDYLNRYRVNQSIYDLVHTDKSLLEIALDNGFQSNKSYSNSFRKYYGTLPSVYRQEHTVSATSADWGYDEESLTQKAKYLYENYWKKNTVSDEALYSNPLAAEKPIPLSLEFSMEHPQTIMRDQRIKLITVGSITCLLQEEIIEQLKLLKRYFHFTHIHVRDIFNDYLKIYSNPYPDMHIFFWGDLLRAIDKLIELGFTPFLELGYMPADLSSTADQLAYTYRPFVGVPKSMETWGRLIREFLTKCLEIYGEQVFTWHFDFWNTANLNMKGGYWAGNQAQFFEMYKVTWDTFQSVDKRLKLGTPTFSIPDGISWYEDFFNFCKAENIHPSHFSVHMYSCMDKLDAFEGIFPYASSPVNYLTLTSREHISNLVGLLHEVATKHGFGDLPLVVAEWNITYFLSDLIRDTAFMATYIAHTYIHTLSDLSCLGFFCLSDINDQFRPSNMLFDGASGLFTWQGTPKPAANAFYLLHKLDPDIVELGDNYIVTKSRRGFHVLVYNMADYEKRPEDNTLAYTAHDYRYQVFTNTTPIQFRCLIHVKHGNYEVKTYVLDRKNGTFYDAWLRMGKPDRIIAEILEVLKRQSFPSVFYEKQEDTNVIRLDETVYAHGIILFEVAQI